MRHLAHPIIAWLLLTGGAAVTAGEFPQVAEYRLDVRFDPDNSAMSGEAEVTFREDSEPSPTVTCFLHGEVMVDSVVQAGQRLHFKQQKTYYDRDYTRIADRVEISLVSVDPSEPITIWYDGFFHASRARSESDFMRIDSTGVYLRAYYYSPWFPFFVDPDQQPYNVSFSEVRIHVPPEMTCVFTGHLVSDEVVEGDRVSVWSGENINLAAAQCIAREFTTLKAGAVNVYCWPDDTSVAAGKKIVEFVSWITGEYSKRYSHSAESSELHVMEMPEYGDISGGNVSGMISDSWLQFESETWPRRHLAHELVHPFVQVPVEQTDPIVAMDIEGFPTYFHLPVLEDLLGREWYVTFLTAREEGYLKMKETGLSRRGRRLPVEKPIDQILFDDIGEYKDLFIMCDRAPLFLNYLREKMGGEQFGRFAGELCNLDKLTDQRFRDLVEKYLPGSREDVRLWLSTNEYPERFHLGNIIGD